MSPQATHHGPHEHGTGAELERDGKLNVGRSPALDRGKFLVRERDGERRTHRKIMSSLVVYGYTNQLEGHNTARQAPIAWRVSTQCESMVAKSAESMDWAATRHVGPAVSQVTRDVYALLKALKPITSSASKLRAAVPDPRGPRAGESTRLPAQNGKNSWYLFTSNTVSSRRTVGTGSRRLSDKRVAGVAAEPQMTRSPRLVAP